MLRNEITENKNVVMVTDKFDSVPEKNVVHS